MANFIGTKEDGSLVFMRELDGKVKTIKYDFASKGFFSQTKNGNWRSVESVSSFFRKCSPSDVFESFQDEAYRKFLLNVYHRVTTHQNRRLSNIGSILEYVGKYSFLEQYSVLGISLQGNGVGLNQPISIYPKDVISFLKEGNLKLESKLENIFSPNSYYGSQEKRDEYKALCLNTVRHIMASYHMDLEVYEEFYSIVTNYHRFITYASCVSRYNLEYKAFLNYLVKLYRTEALDFGEATTMYNDYMNMSRELRDHRVDKYPTNLRLRHDITVKNYRTARIKFDLEKFKSAVDYSYDWTDNKFAVVAPITTDEVKEEGNKLSHCVASYIRKIIDGYCQILFFRDLEDGNNPLLTLEVRDNTIVQVRGKSNRYPLDSENEVLMKFAKAKNLNYLDVKRVVEEERGED